MEITATPTPAGRLASGEQRKEEEEEEEEVDIESSRRPCRFRWKEGEGS